MVLIGKHTKCRLCGESVRAPDVTTIRHFIGNTKDRLAPLSGTALHPACLAASPLREVAEHFADLRRKHVESECHCIVCGEPVVQDAEDSGLTTEILSSDPEHPLYEFNFICIHREHLEEWPRIGEFRAAVQQATERGIWRGEPLIRRTQVRRRPR